MTAPPQRRPPEPLTPVAAARRAVQVRASLAHKCLAEPWLTAQYLDPGYVAQAHHRLMSREFRDWHTAPDSRLLITTAPQVGKSWTVVVWGTFWMLAQNPSLRVIIACATKMLAQKHGQEIRDRIQEFGGMFGLKLRRGSNRAAEFYTDRGGYVLCVGVGGMTTGFSANCVEYTVEVQTRLGPMPIGEYVESGCTADVLSYDHELGEAVWAPVTATSSAEGEVVEVVTRSGRSIRCTPDHRVYVAGRGYVAASEIQPGEHLLATHLDPDVRPLRTQVRTGSAGSQQGAAAQPDRDVLFQGLQQPLQARQAIRSAIGAVLRPVREDVRDSPVRARQAAPQGSEGVLLLATVPGRRTARRVQVLAVRRGGAEDPPVLLRSLQAGSQEATHAVRGAGVSAVPGDVPADQQPHHLLLTRLREQGALRAADRRWELPVQHRNVVRELVPCDAPPDPRTRQAPLRCLRCRGALHRVPPSGETVPEEHLPRSPHQRGPQGQHRRESRDALRRLPHDPPQVGYDTVAVVRRVRGERFRVYDLQVEGTHNFFAGEVLVHNCFIIDDPFKDWAEAHSPTYRDKKWLWAASVARTRLQHGGRILHVATRWHEDDVAGRFMQRMPGVWRMVRLPAIADSPDDPLGRQPGDPLPKPGVDEHDAETLLHDWKQAQAESPFVVWQAMYQGDPAPPGGTLVDTDLLERIEDLNPQARPVMRAVSVDPSIGGQSAAQGSADGRQNTAGIVAGWLGNDNRCYWTHDATAVMTVEEWSERALLLAIETASGVIFIEDNQGGTAWRVVFVAAWERLRAKGLVQGHMPRLALHHAKGDKATRAQIVSGFMHGDRIRFAAKMPRLAMEWTSWRPGDESPGGIDASGHLALQLLPDSQVNHAPPASPADSPLSGGGPSNPYPWR